MANRIRKLTKRTVDALKPSDRDTVYWERELTGFGVRVRKTGRKHYVVQTRVGGRLRWFTVGQHGPFTPEDARTAALEILAQARRGIDPRSKLTKPPFIPVMTDLSTRFTEEYVSAHCKPNTRVEYGRCIKLSIDPAIGAKKVSEVARGDIAKLHHAMRDRPYQANRTLAVLSKMFSMAEVWGWRADGSNPCRHVRRYKERPRERFLTPEEADRLGAVLREVEHAMPAAVTAFRLLLLTGCRLSEIRTLRWEYVKDDCIELPDSKTGGRVVPLGPEARAVLAAVPRDDDNPWVIAGRQSDAPLANLHRPWSHIRKRAGLEGVRIHDLRHTSAAQELLLTIYQFFRSIPLFGVIMTQPDWINSARALASASVVSLRASRGHATSETDIHLWSISEPGLTEPGAPRGRVGGAR